MFDSVAGLLCTKLVASHFASALTGSVNVYIGLTSMSELTLLKSIVEVLTGR